MLAASTPVAGSRESGTELAGALKRTRDRTLALVAPLSTQQLETVHSPLMSPLVWDLGHIAAFEDLWLIHRVGGAEMLRPDLAEVYDAFETPRWQRGELPFLRRDEALSYLAAVRERVLAGLARDGVCFEHELVLRHELQHNETMLQTIELARLPDFQPSRRATVAAPGRPASQGGLELVTVDGGACEIGAAADGFAYDNERPRRRVQLPSFQIGRTPVTNATWLRFTEGGGYQRREWWSREGWAWKEDEDITRPGGWTGDGREWRIGGYQALDPSKPVIHVSWFEADAFARAHDARLPSELEWEKAATWDRQTRTPRRWPWGERPGDARHANLDRDSFGVEPLGDRGSGRSPYGCEAMLGDVWEWTSSRFDGYPGFVARPYREYSEVFFGGDNRVLRGGSWATSARVATPTFRNWDHPQRRQIFAGLRIARSLH